MKFHQRTLSLLAGIVQHVNVNDLHIYVNHFKLMFTLNLMNVSKYCSIAYFKISGLTLGLKAIILRLGKIWVYLFSTGMMSKITLK